MTASRTTRSADVRNEECVLAKTAVHSMFMRSKGPIVIVSRSAMFAADSSYSVSQHVLWRLASQSFGAGGASRACGSLRSALTNFSKVASNVALFISHPVKSALALDVISASFGLCQLPLEI
jgi:hypothetical protein